jgi:hypothetical protein
VEKTELLGIERMEDDSGVPQYRSYYWCRVTPLSGQYTPEHEIAVLKLLDPSHFLDAISRGRNNRIAQLLLARSLEIERTYQQSQDV